MDHFGGAVIRFVTRSPNGAGGRLQHLLRRALGEELLHCCCTTLTNSSVGSVCTSSGVTARGVSASTPCPDAVAIGVSTVTE